MAILTLLASVLMLSPSTGPISLAPQANPHVPYRVPTALAVTGSTPPGTGSTWEIVKAADLVATNLNTNGWYVTHSAPSTLTVSAPYGISPINGLEVRFNAQGVGKSTTFDLVPRGVEGGILDIWVRTGGTQQVPSNPGSYTIYKGGNIVDIGGSDGWLQTWVGPHGELLPQPFHIAIHVPADVALGTDYEWRASDSLDALPVPQHYSSNFDIVAPVFGFPINIQADPPFGFLSEPMVLVPWMESLKPSDSADSPDGGPASIFSVDLVHGVLTASTGVDVVAANTKGPDVPFGLTYRSALSAANLSSPGLPPGWVHNWDLRIVSLEAPAPGPVGGGGAAGGGLMGLFASLMPAPSQWANLQLIFPSGASIMLQPVIGTGGNPTGEFLVPAGTPFIVEGVPTTTLNVWTNITLVHSGLARDVFTKPAGDSFFRLTKVIHDNAQELNLTYTGGKLLSIANSGQTLLSVAYGGGGFISTVTENVAGKARTYTYSGNQLSTVSQLGTTAVEWLFTYQTIEDRKYLNSARSKDPHGVNQTATVTYESATGRVHSLLDANSKARSYGYLPSGGANVSLVDFWNPDNYTVECDSLGRLSRYTTAAGDPTQFIYNGTNPALLERIIEPLGGQAFVSEVDSHGNPGRVTTTQGSYVRYTWEYPDEAPKGRISQVQEFSSTGGAKPATTISYYGAGDPDGKIGMLKTIVDQGVDTTTYKYTALGNIKTITSTGSGTTTFGYDQDKLGVPKPERYGLPYYVRPGSSTGSVPDTTWFNYDTRGRTIETTDSKGAVSTFTWNDYGQITAATGPNGYGLTTTRPVLGQAATSFKSTKVGQTIATLFENTYDAESAIATFKDGSSSSAGPKIESPRLNTQYDLKALTNGNGQQAHGFTPYPVQRRLDVKFGTGARSLTEKIFSNRNGLLETVHGQENSRSVHLSRNQTTSVVNSIAFTMLGTPNGTADASFTYDAFGRPSSTFSWAQTSGSSNSYSDLGTKHDYLYSDRDQVIRDDVTNETRGGTQGISYGYNPNGSRQFMIVDIKDSYGNNAATYPKVKFEYTYDAIGRISDIAAYYQTGTGSLITPAVARATYSYDANGRIIAVRTLKSTILYEYNDAGQLIGQINATKDGLLDPFAPTSYNFTDPHNGTAHTKLSEFTNISYNARGHIISMSFLAATTLGTSQQQTAYGTGSVTFGYDGGGRLLTEAWTGSGSSAVNLVHEYDNADNLKKLRSNTWTIDPGSDQVLTGSLAGYTSPSYNSSGEVTALNGFEFLYGAQGRLGLINGTSLEKGAFTNIALDQRSNYDADGLRTYQVFSFGTSANQLDNEQMFLYDGTALLCRWVGLWGNGGTHNAVNAVSDLGQSWAPDAFVLYLWGPTGPVMEFDMLGNSKAFLYDPLGNTLNTTTHEGLAEKPLFYDGYGMLVWPDAPGSDRMRRQPFQYKGQAGYYGDAHTGLYYCHNRYYDPRLGSWLSRDPIGLDGGVNLYSYCGGNPVMFWDPSGLDFRDWFFGNSFGQLFVGENWRLGTYTGGSATLNVFSLGFYNNETAAQMPGYGTSRGFANVSFQTLTTAVPVTKAVQGARVVAVTARLKVLTKRVIAKKPPLTAPQAKRVAVNPRLRPAYEGERLDAMLKQDVGQDNFLRLLGVQTTPGFKFGPDFFIKDGFLGRGRWWDLTTRARWDAHVTKYGKGGIPLFHR